MAEEIKELVVKNKSGEDKKFNLRKIKEEVILAQDFLFMDDGSCKLLEHAFIPRREAIAEMAYAMLKTDSPEAANEWLQLQWNSIRIRKHYMVMAEAALNAMLEGK